MARLLRDASPEAPAIRHDVARLRQIYSSVEVTVRRSYGLYPSNHAAKCVRTLDRILARIGGDALPGAFQLPVPRTLQPGRVQRVGRLDLAEHDLLVAALHEAAAILSPPESPATWIDRSCYSVDDALANRCGRGWGASQCDAVLIVQRHQSLLVLALGDRWREEHERSGQRNVYTALRDGEKRERPAPAVQGLRGLDGHAGHVARVAVPSPSWTPVILPGGRS